MLRPIPTCAALDHLDDHTVLSHVRELARRDSALLATLLAHLVLVDERKLYLGEGFASLFDYCRDGLGWSESESWRRIQATRLCRRFPVVLSAIGEGRLTLSAACVLSPHLTEDNASALVGAAVGLRKRDLEALVQGMTSRRDAAPPPLPGEVATPSTGCRSLFDYAREPLTGGQEPRREATAASPVGPTPLPTPLPPTASSVAPPAPPGVRPARPPALTVRATPALMTSLDKARALMAHVPGGTDTTVVLERALALLVEKLEKARFGAKKRAPRKDAAEPSPQPSGIDVVEEAAPEPVQAVPPETATPPAMPERVTRRRAHIPARVRRAVYDRDEGRCTFVGQTGHRCGSRFGLQLHHRHAWAHGGPDTAENLTVHCSSHNKHQADRDGLGQPRRRRSAKARAFDPPSRLR